MTACPRCRSENFWILLEGGVECDDCGYDGRPNTRLMGVLVVIACIGAVIGLGSIWWNLVNK